MVAKRRLLFLWLVVGGGLLILVAGLLIANMSRSAFTMKTPTPTIVSEVRRISVEEAKAAFDTNEAIFIDVRDSSSYEKSHIPGALLVSLINLTDQLSTIDNSRWIITYCS